MANPSTAHEPSMEEILASIRQIISEDGDSVPAGPNEAKGADQSDAAGQGGTRPAPPAAARNPLPEIVRPAVDPGLASRRPAGQNEPMKTSLAEPPMKASPQAEPPSPPLGNRGAEAAAAAQPSRHAANSEPTGRQSEERMLLSQQSDAAVSGAFGALAHTIFAQNARTMDDLVGEILRPMLREWLDDNLPSLVERLVKEEIERVSRGRR